MKVWIAAALFYFGFALAACNTTAEKLNEADLLEIAAVEATQIIQKAQATAMVLEAQSQATALITRMGKQTSVQAGTEVAGRALPVETLAVQYADTSDGRGNLTLTPVPQTVELLGVGLGGESLFIEVYFRAPPATAGQWYQGNVSVMDEVSGTVYSEIPLLPVIGPLFGKPVEAGQIGYVMFVNAPLPLVSGTLVTVTLGDYVFKHIPVK